MYFLKHILAIGIAFTISIASSAHHDQLALHHLRTSQGTSVDFLQLPEAASVQLLIAFKQSGWADAHFQNEYLLAGIVAELLQEEFQHRLKRHPQLEAKIQVQFGFPIDYREYFVIRVESPFEHLKESLALLTQSLNSPRFSSKMLQKHLEHQLTQLKQSDTFKILLNPPSLFLAKYALWSLMTHQKPILLPEIGERIQHAVMTRKSKDILRYMRSHFVQENMRISVVGNLAPEDLLQALDSILGSLAHRTPQYTSVSRPDSASTSEAILVSRKFSQEVKHHIFSNTETTMLCFGQPWPPFSAAVNTALAPILEGLLTSYLNVHLKILEGPVIGLDSILSGCIRLEHADVPHAVRHIHAFFQSLNTMGIDPKKKIMLQKEFKEAISKEQAHAKQRWETWHLPENLSTIDTKEPNKLLWKLFNDQTHVMDWWYFPDKREGFQNRTDTLIFPEILDLEDIIRFVLPPEKLTWVEVGPKR